MVLLFTVVACIAAVFPTAAHAYLDPGTASFLLQAVIASLLILPAVIKIHFQRIKEFFKDLRRRRR